MSVVSSKTNRFIGIILNSKFKFMLNFNEKSRTLLKIPSDITGVRNLHLTRNAYANISFNLTDIGEGIREVVVKEWYVDVGNRVAQFDKICEVQSDKASVTITSRYDGLITKLYYDVDATAYVGKPLVDIETDTIQKEESNNTEEGTTSFKNETTTSSQDIFDDKKNYKKSLCIPSVRRIAKENNVNLDNVQGTGRDGRILKQDILKFLQQSKPEQQIVQTVKTDKSEPIRGFKKAMIKTMTEALKIPHFVYCDEIAVTKLSEIRKLVKEDLAKSGIKLTLLPFFIKAVSNSLNEFPILNAVVDENCENITYKSSHNIGVAMDTNVGLAVPVIKNVEKLSILEIAKEISRLSKSGKEGNFELHDLTDGTFSISNIGAIGGTYASPVILPPQVAIIALGTLKVLPRFDNENKIIAEEIINVSGSADHRVVDGATMANFINSLKKQIENPYLLFLHT